MHDGLEQLENGTSNVTAPRASDLRSECSGTRERSEQCGASEGAIRGASERPNGRASGPVLTYSTYVFAYLLPSHFAYFLLN